MIIFALIYWGAPFYRFDTWPSGYVTWEGAKPIEIYAAATFGGIVLATAIVFGLVRLAKPNFGGRLAMFGLVILSIIIATGCAAAHSRAQFGILEGASKKYSSFAALWLAFLHSLRKSPTTSGKRESRAGQQWHCFCFSFRSPHSGISERRGFGKR